MFYQWIDDEGILRYPGPFSPSDRIVEIPIELAVESTRNKVLPAYNVNRMLEYILKEYEKRGIETSKLRELVAKTGGCRS